MNSDIRVGPCGTNQQSVLVLRNLFKHTHTHGGVKLYARLYLLSRMSWNKYKYLLTFYDHRLLKSFLIELKDLSIWYCHYYGCWRPSNTGSQGISSCVTLFSENILPSTPEGLMQKRHNFYKHWCYIFFYANPSILVLSVTFFHIVPLLYVTWLRINDIYIILNQENKINPFSTK